MSLAGDGMRVSPVRVMVVLLVAAALITSLVWWLSPLTRGADAAVDRPLNPLRFAGYVDVTATPTYAFESPESASSARVVLAFVVANPDRPCQPTWGSTYTLDEADRELDLSRRLALLQLRGGAYSVSFGGAANDELATVCTDADALVGAYAEVVARYGVPMIDLDLEFNDLASRDGNIRRAEAIARLQRARLANGEPLEVWLTLPADPDGLTVDGVNAVAGFQAAGVDLAGVNVMTMNYGASKAPGQTMVEASTQALTAVRDQLIGLYARAGLRLSDDEAWTKVGMTPMVGQSDVAGEVVTLADARALNQFARTNALGRISMWSLNRDRACGVNQLLVSVVSDSCSGVAQGKVRYADLLAARYALPTVAATPAGVGTDTAVPQVVHAGGALAATPHGAVADDPASSPYPRWSASTEYSVGAKVVWRGGVYVAKRWNVAEEPDTPDVEEWQVSWRLLGPVLAGEKPAKVPRLPKGTFAQWDPNKIYRKGDRVLVGSRPYRAKWWTQGDSPDVARSAPEVSAWKALDALQVRRILQRRGLD